MPRFFIGYALIGKEKEKVDAIRHEIAFNFGVQGALRMPPHLTFFAPFDTVEVRPLEGALRKLAEATSPCMVGVTGFNYFEEAVWFIDVQQAPGLLAIKKSVEDVVKEALHIEEDRKGHEIHFHVTLAYRDMAQNAFGQIRDFLKDKEPPIGNIKIDALTLFQYQNHAWRPWAVFPFQK